MSPMLQTVLAALGVGAMGTAGVVIPKVVDALGKIGALLVAICGTPTQPGVQQHVEQLATDMAALKAAFDKHVDADVPQRVADGEAWGHRIDARLDAGEAREQSLDTRVSALEQGKDANPVVASRE